MELKEMTGVLTDLGCSSDQKETAKRMYDTGQIEGYYSRPFGP